jgi:hypothetical protein
LIWVGGETESFFDGGWTLMDTGIGKLPDGQISRPARTALATRHANVPIYWTNFTIGIGGTY